MSDPLILAVPSKGRLKEQVDAWLQDCGLGLAMSGGDRGYRARLRGAEGVQVRLLSAGDIAEALVVGDVHLGVTGEDLLREQGPGSAEATRLLRPLGFGRADLVVAAPQADIGFDPLSLQRPHRSAPSVPPAQHRVARFLPAL